VWRARCPRDWRAIAVDEYQKVISNSVTRTQKLVLLHGFAATARQWLDHGPAAALAEQGNRVILPDLRGHGDSARPHDPAATRPMSWPMTGSR
jgi:pimeloyl-ACP methyl ester carboxylesterase